MLVPNDGICTRKFKNETNREVNGTGAETLKWSQVLVHVTVFKHFGQCSAWKEIVDLFQTYREEVNSMQFQINSF